MSSKEKDAPDNLTFRTTATFRKDMKQLGPYRKYVTIAAIVQSVIVIVAGYLLFKSQANRDPADTVPKKPHVEQTAPKTK